ncbi:MAG: hypothetical protein J5777_01160 [Clostridiales bacterium]|nr:hypothetical protein [Clostridiales bacterium]
MVRTFLNRSVSFILALLVTASILLSCFGVKTSADSPYTLSGTSFITGVGHSIGKFDCGILTLGQKDSGKGLQTLNVNLAMNDKTITGSLQYRICVSKKGWQEWASNGQNTGMSTKPRQITAIQMKLDGQLGEDYSIWYSASTDLHKDLEGWVCDGAVAGSSTEGRRVEEIRVMLVRRNRIEGNTDISVRSYMQSSGWEKTWKYNKLVSGRPGRKKRMEGIEIALRSNEYTGGIQYRAFVSGVRGWQNWVTDGETCGILGQKKRIEAIEIKLYGEVANHYDIYYRTYIGGLGWFNWSKNGEAAGSRGIGRRVEGIQIALVRKNAAAPSALRGIKTTFGYSFVTTNDSSGVSEWKIGTGTNFGSTVLRRAKYYNRTPYKEMRCDALVAACLVDALGTDLGKANKNNRYARLNEWIGLSALESLLSNTFTYKDSAGRVVICRPVAQTKLKKLVRKTWKKKEVYITEDEFNTWLTTYCKPGDIIIFYNKKKKPIHCAIYAGIQSTSVKEYEYFHGKKKGDKEIDLKPGPYVWHSGYDTGVANKYAFWVAEVGRSYYVKRYRVDSGKMQPPAPKQQYST